MDFFSYASSDRAIAEVIHRELTARRIELWWDKDREEGRGLAPGQAWVEELDRALSAAKGYLVLCGARGVARWVQWEMDIAIRRAVDDPQFRIIPLVLDTAATGELPPRLAAYHTIPLDGDLLSWSKERWDELAARLGRSGVSPVLAAPIGRPPFPGLASFVEADERFFYGRD